MPVLTATTPEVIQDQGQVVALVKSDGRNTYVIASNYERESTRTRIGVAGMDRGTAEVLFGGPGTSDATVSGGQFAADFRPLETRVYRVRD